MTTTSNKPAAQMTEEENLQAVTDSPVNKALEEFTKIMSSSDHNQRFDDMVKWSDKWFVSSDMSTTLKSIFEERMHNSGR